ncbi:MAG: hypothetical protein ABSH48_00995 [Verrucomicrobiota bacterium]|jgi:hypothetical protein
MPKEEKSELTPTQQAMLDLALACDLKVSDPAKHDVMRTRHQAIRTQRDAAAYIREVEVKIHSRRRFRKSAAGAKTRSVPFSNPK